MYPVTYSQSPPEARNRLTVFFRYFCVLPHMLVAAVYGFAAFFAIVAAWFSIVLTGKYPEGAYNFVAGFVRFLNRVQAYLYLVTDEYPPFDGGEHPEYPVVAVIPAPLESYDRVKTLLRAIFAIPIIIVSYAMSLWLSVVAIVLWFAGVFAGKTSPNLTEAMRTPMAYYLRTVAYLGLLTEAWPPFDPGPETAPVQPAAPAAPVAPAPAPSSTPPPPDIGLS